MGPQTYFPYVGDHMSTEGVDLGAIARSVGTPVYCYSAGAIERQYRTFAAAFANCRALICYAMKANSNQAVLRVLARQGAGMDVVSGGELRRARAAGVPADRITFSGVGKTETEIADALDEGILCFNVESEPELRTISQIAVRLGRTAPVALRVNPDVDARTHAKIATGRSANKFGIPIAQARQVYREAARLPGLRICGVDMHIGSQITDLAPFDAAFRLLAAFIRLLREDGHAVVHVDLGGGLGVPYKEGEDPASYHPERYAEIVRAHLADLEVALIFEPGRLLVANAGVLVTKTLYVKRGEHKTFLIVDAAMNDLMRPTLYEAYHEIRPLSRKAGDRASLKVDVVGPVCETGDYLALDRVLPEMAPGDLLGILSAGAYGAAQASGYNSRLLAPEVLVSDGRWSVVRPRPTYEDLMALDQVPDWLR